MLNNAEQIKMLKDTLYAQARVLADLVEEYRDLTVHDTGEMRQYSQELIDKAEYTLQQVERVEQ